MARSPPRRRNDGARDRRDDRDRNRSNSPRDRRHDDRDRDRDRDRHREHRDRDDRDRRDRDRRDDRRGRDYYESRRNGRDERDTSRHGDHHQRGHGSRDRESRRTGGRDTSTVREGERRRAREPDDYDDDRRRKRTRRDSSNHSGSSHPRTAEPPKKTASGPAQKPVPAEEERKKKELEEEQRKEQEERRRRVEEVKRKRLAAANNSAASPAQASPTTSHPDIVVGSPDPRQDGPQADLPPKTKFDPKAIKKRADAAMAKAKATPLGGDAPLPVQGNVGGTKTAGANRTNGINKVQQGDAKISGFGLNKGAADKIVSDATKANAALEEDEDIQRKFRKLPDLPHPTNSDDADAALADGQEDQDEAAEDLRSDEEEATAAREAAQKRAEDSRAVQQDIAIPEAVLVAPTAPGGSADDTAMDVDEEVDPLDQFMSSLETSIERAPPAPVLGRGQKLFGEDEGPDLDAVGEDPEGILGAKRKKKEFPVVDHSKVEYEPFRKNFYAEPIEVADMTDDDIDKLRADLDNIQVHGLDAPKPITKWSHCGFGAQILDVIREQKFERPTSIQSQALPALMSGRDTIGIAKTGSGKTLAFILPMFRHIKDQRLVANLEGPIGLILAPTRELAVQIHRECKPYLKALNLRGVCAYGGAPIKDQIAELKRGAEVVVCTPGRLIDLLAANSGRVTNLSRVTYVVMDEADRMFDMGFEPQITRVLNNIRPDHQTALFSATFPKKIEFLAKKALKKPVQILVGGRSVVAAEITQVIEIRSEKEKFRRVLELLSDLHENDEDARSLIFVERQESADNIFKELGAKGYPSVSVHGGREQIDRDQAILDFKAGVIPIMVATSVAARGLDVKQLKLVINYDSPNHGEDYVHRAGRTGRAGNTGTAVTFVTPEQERFAPFLVRALEDSQQEVPAALKEMAESHKRKVESGEAKMVSMGFGGRGIERLDSARAEERAREKKQFKTGDDDDADEDEKAAKDKKEKSVNELVAKAVGPVKGSDSPAAASSAGLDEKLLEHLNNALKVQKTEKPEQKPVANDPQAKAAAAAAAITARIGTNKETQRPGAPLGNRGPDAGAFHATLEINDFPQRARWAVTNRTNVAKILDATGTSITSKGIYYAAGKEPQQGDEPKLYILVEGDTDVVVKQAMTELTRLLKEGVLLAQEQESRGGGGGGGGRYRVV